MEDSGPSYEERLNAFREEAARAMFWRNGQRLVSYLADMRKRISSILEKDEDPTPFNAATHV